MAFSTSQMPKNLVKSRVEAILTFPPHSILSLPRSRVIRLAPSICTIELTLGRPF